MKSIRTRFGGRSGKGKRRQEVSRRSRWNRPLGELLEARLVLAAPAATDDSYSTPLNTPLNVIASTTSTQVFSADFQTGLPSANWSATNTSTAAANPARRFLGLFRNNPVTLSLSALPAHNQLEISFDLYVLGSWDGTQGFGNDRFTFGVSGQTALLDASFSNGNNLQTYPNTGSPARTGAVENNTLGSGGGDSVYHFTFTVPHSAATVAFAFDGNNLGGFGGGGGEDWGLDNVVVSAKTSPITPTQTLLPLGATWKYLDNGSDQGTAWRNTVFDDSTWASGPSELGYNTDGGEAPEATVLGYGGNIQNKYITYYFRTTFALNNPAEITALSMTLFRDDGAAVYLNGNQIHRSNLPENATFLTVADTSAAESGNNVAPVTQTGINVGFLNAGTNTLAVEVHQNSGDSTDLSFNLDLVATLSPVNAVLVNDTDADNDPLVAQIQTQPTHGILAWNANNDGGFTYTPNAGYTGPDSFTYQAFDGTNPSNIATVSITVGGAPNFTPVAVNDNYSVPEEGFLDVLGTGVLTNDTDDGPTGKPIIANLIAGPTHGTLEWPLQPLAEPGSFKYTPFPEYSGVDTFTYRAGDGLLTSNLATVTITVTPTNDPPTANPNSYNVNEGAVLNIAGPGVLANDTDPDGDNLRALLVTGPAHGTLEWNAANNGGFIYTPNFAYFGPDSFTYKANDGTVDSGVVTVSIEVIDVDAPPLAAPDSYSVDEDGQLVRTAAQGVLVNDQEPENQSMTALYVVGSGPAHGILEWNASNDGGFTYTPTPNYSGPDSFQYRASDGNSNSAAVTVSITVNVTNDAPVAANNSYLTPSGTQLTVSLPQGVLGNDSDPENDSITAILVSGPTSGTLVGGLASDGTFVYSPAAGFHGTATFTYKARDAGLLESNEATVTILVNDPAVAATNSYQVNEDDSLGINAPGVLANDTDAENDPLTAILVYGPSHGAVIWNPANNGGFTYTPAGNYAGPDSFTYKANDGDQDSTPVTVNITVNAINDAPVAQSDEYNVLLDTPLVVDQASGLLANDSDVDGPSLTAVLVTPPQHGSLSQPFGVGGSFTYTATLGFSGVDTFTYRATDGSSQSDEVTVTLNVAIDTSKIVINEIMYHSLQATQTLGDGTTIPAEPERPLEEWIELRNIGTSPINISGWQFSKGVSYTIPNSTILAAGGFQVIAADVATFTTGHPGVTNVIGGWTGTLANRGETIQLDDQHGNLVDEVEYAHEGDWGLRRSVTVGGALGWDWQAAHDGQGRTLEVVNAALSNNQGQNWTSSNVVGGTPGAANSVADADAAPLILDVQHSPMVPTTTDSVTITARIVDELVNDPARFVELFSRNATSTTPPNFAATAMFDDGAHGDGLAGDGVYGVILPPQPVNGTIVEFYVRATDAAINRRTWPAATAVNQTQGANALYQVDNTVYTGTQPLFRIIMTAADLAAFNAQSRQSDAQQALTWISSDGVDFKTRYAVTARYRGQGTRNANPPNLRISFNSDDRWNDFTDVNLNTRFTHAQVAGMNMFRLAGLPAENTQAVQVRVNAANLAQTGNPMFGSYAMTTAYDGEQMSEVLPNDANGNVYRISGGGGGLQYRGDTPVQDPPISQTEILNYVNNSYRKTTNTSQWDWSDLFAMTNVVSNAPVATLFQDVSTVANLQQWARWYAVNMLVGNNENGIATGTGDDYSMYRGVVDPRFILLPHDMDTTLGQGDSPAGTSDNLFQGTAIANINRIFSDPAMLQLYYQQFVELATGIFSAQQFNAYVDNALGSWVPAATITAMKNFAAARVAYVLSSIPLTFNVTSALPISNGYPRATTATTTITGNANEATTRNIRVNGVLATWSARPGGSGGAPTSYARTWTAAGVALKPGINRLLVQALDAAGVEVDRRTYDVWYDDTSVTTVSGNLPAGTTTWLADSGPYSVTGTVNVPNGSTLVIEPGTTVYFAQGTGLNVNGGLLTAVGTETSRIRLTRVPGAAGTWNGIAFTGTTLDNQLKYADQEYSGNTNVDVTNSSLSIDHAEWFNTSVQILDLTNSSISMTNSKTPNLTNVEPIHLSGLPANGFAIFQGNDIGTTTGFNDVMDLTGGNRPGAIVQILDNLFHGSDDDILDLDGTDAHIEGNVFMNSHHNNPNNPNDTSSAISGGRDSGNTSELTIVRNFFYNNDHALLTKEGNSAVMVNNTIVDTDISIVNFDEPGNNTAGPGLGVLLEGNIIVGVPLLFENTNAGTQITVNRNILPAATSFPGVGNIVGDPRLVNTVNVTNPRIDFKLRPGSPAVGTGFNGANMGADVPAGATISGEPLPVTNQTTATLTVGGPDIYGYKYKVNNGAFSAEVPVTPATPSAAVVIPPISLTGLTNGVYTVYVAVKNSAGVWQPDAQATASRSWTVNSAAKGLFINEVLANNTTINVGGTFPDIIELRNDSATTIDLTGMSISDDPNLPNQFIFPNGTTIPAGGYLTVYADSAATPGLHTGFALSSSSGDSVRLYNTAASGGAELDSVIFGVQIPNFSIARDADGVWGLAVPTIGASNVMQPTGQTSTLRINEWLANPELLFVSDFIELYNPDTIPVNVGGLYLSENTTGDITHHQIAPLSFIAAGGFTFFNADDNEPDGANHLNFTISADNGILGLVAANGSTIIDHVLYPEQRRDVSQGRLPDGGPLYSFFNVPTPGAPNSNVGTPPVNLFNLVNHLRVTEIMYNPLGSNAFEYMEVQNTGATALDLTGVRITNGIDFVFPAVNLAPGAYTVIVANQASFQARYGNGIPIAGVYTGNLSNGGEGITLTLPAPFTGEILDFNYSDSWYLTTDGGGPSLVIIDSLAPADTWSDKDSWRASYSSNGSPGTGDVLLANVTARWVYYNNSTWDGNNAASGPSDDTAIATDKSALLPGGTATFANYTSYSKGINGVMIDVMNPAGTITGADFAFRTGNNNAPGSWQVLATAPTVSMRPGAGAGGSDRISLTWPDGTITKTWLQVTMLATAATGLVANDVFYFGNAIGEAGDTTANALVNATDEIQARANQRNILNPAPIDFKYDYNRDKLVNATDQIIARTNVTNIVTGLRLIVPAPSAAALPAAGALADAALAAGDAGEADDVLARRRKR